MRVAAARPRPHSAEAGRALFGQLGGCVLVAVVR
eukprot:COSAG02_NODE_28911_length_579_cov_18.537500_1_plen_33_part_10